MDSSPSRNLDSNVSELAPETQTSKRRWVGALLSCFYILVKYNFILESQLILMHDSSQGLLYTFYPDLFLKISRMLCRKVVEKTVVRVRVGENAGKSKNEGPPSDFWSWRKYGQKPIKGSPYPRYHLLSLIFGSSLFSLHYMYVLMVQYLILLFFLNKINCSRSARLIIFANVNLVAYILELKSESFLFIL